MKCSPYENQGASAFDLHWRRYNECTYRVLENLLGNLSNVPESILDIGCGTGNVLMILRDRFPQAKLTGIDPSASMLSFAQKKSHGADLQQGTIEDAPQKRYDLLVSMSMFHYVAHPVEWLSHARTLLTENGHLLLLDWNGSSPLMFLRRQWLQSQSHIAHVYTKKEMEDMLCEWRHVSSLLSTCCFGWWGVQGYLLHPPF